MPRYTATESCLAGSPYILPPRSEVQQRVETLVEREERARHRLERAMTELRKSGIFQTVTSYGQAREVYESNSLEGLGPDLGATHQILSGQEGRTVEEALTSLSLTDDPDMLAVIGLNGAKLLARRLESARADGRPWTESDLRSLHGIICDGEAFAGRYKRYHVLIAGEDAHEPSLPIDVSSKMNELVGWLNSWDGKSSAVVRAAVAHAWLTHIHPLEDGNGRLARLLANQCLAVRGLPPAIVKHKAQRGAYLDALRLSDDGGDIFAFCDLMMNSVMRYVREVSKPANLERIIDQELSGRSAPMFLRWREAMDQFVSELNSGLRLQNLQSHTHGELDSESFRYISDLDARGNAWLQSVIKGDRELLMWFGYPTSDIRGHLPKRNVVPAVFFSVRNDQRYTFRPFRALGASSLEGLSQICVVPGPPARVYALRDGRLRVGTLSNAADEIADIIGRAFRAGRIPADVRSTRYGMPAAARP